MDTLVARIVVLALVALGAGACTPGGTADDAANSGADATACGPCPLWTVRCGPRCVDPTVSPNNCGVCGVQCDTSREVCQGGVCVAASRCAALDPGGLGAPTEAGTAAPDASDASAVGDAGRTDGAAPPDAHASDAGVAEAGAPAGAGLRGEYFAHPDLSGLRFVRLDPAIDFDWTTTAPAAGYPRENFAVRWTGTLRPASSGNYSIAVTADDGARVWLDGALVLDAWEGGTTVDAHFERALTAGQSYALRFEYRQTVDMASVHLLWSRDGGARTPVPAAVLQPARGDAWTCANGDCCPVGDTALCCPTGMHCVQDPSFRGCCPEGETCTAVPACTAP